MVWYLAEIGAGQKVQFHFVYNNRVPCRYLNIATSGHFLHETAELKKWPVSLVLVLTRRTGSGTFRTFRCFLIEIKDFLVSCSLLLPLLIQIDCRFLLVLVLIKYGIKMKMFHININRLENDFSYNCICILNILKEKVNILILNQRWQIFLE